MITLDLPNSMSESAGTKPITEGAMDTVKGAINAVTGIDTDKTKDDWNNANVPGKVKVAGDTIGSALGNVDSSIDKIRKDNEVDGRSIVARATNSIKQCPIYITQTIRATEAHLLSKMFEKVYATFFQAAISQNPFITPEEANNLRFMNNYHTDVRESAEKLINQFYQPIDDFDQMMQESVFCEYQLSDRMRVQFSVVPSSISKDLLLENARLMNEPLTGIPYLYYEAKGNIGVGDFSRKSEDTTEDKTTQYDRLSNDKANEIFDDIVKQNMPKDDVDLMNKNPDDIRDEIYARNPLPHTPNGKMTRKEAQEWKDIANKRDAEVNEVLSRRDSIINQYNQDIEKLKNGIISGSAKNSLIGYDSKARSFYTKRTTSKKTTAIKQMPSVPVPELMRQNDIKKINGMDPYMIKATFFVRDPETRANTEIQYLIGIKTVMHLIYAQDLADELYELVTGDVKSLRKVRYKTGEIGFADYMFNIKSLRADASKNINYNKRWIATLKQMANYNKTKGSLLKQPIELLNGRVPIPNATLILSQTDVTLLVNKTGIDLSQISNARRLAKNLFLIAIAIVDPTAGSMRVFFPDRDTDWDVQSLASIDAEVAKTDNSNLLKELQKAVNNR